MSDFDLDDRLADAVHHYREHTLPQIKPVGAAVAQTTATRRRRIQLAAVSLAALVLVAAPIGVYAATDHAHNGPPDIGSPTPSATVSTNPTTTTAPITDADLREATLNLPPWPAAACPTGAVSFRDGLSTGGGSAVHLGKTAQVDLDNDGAVDVIAIFSCAAGDPWTQQAVAFRRAADNSIQTIGSVANGTSAITDIRAGVNGTVDLQVSDLRGTGGGAISKQVIQWRTYRFTGSGFEQSGGSTSFDIAVPGVTASISDLVFDLPVGGVRPGHLTISIRNDGTTAISDVSLIYYLTQGTVTSPTCPEAIPGLTPSGRCSIGSIAAGDTTQLTLTLTAQDSEVSSFKGRPTPLDEAGEVAIQINVGDKRLTPQPSLGNLVVK